ncbi:MAG: hypothetical protein R3C10_23675 [Pirellulales bacterium]
MAVIGPIWQFDQIAPLLSLGRWTVAQIGLAEEAIGLVRETALTDLGSETVPAEVTARD